MLKVLDKIRQSLILGCETSRALIIQESIFAALLGLANMWCLCDYE